MAEFCIPNIHNYDKKKNRLVFRIGDANPRLAWRYTAASTKALDVSDVKSLHIVKHAVHTNYLSPFPSDPSFVELSDLCERAEEDGNVELKWYAYDYIDANKLAMAKKYVYYHIKADCLDKVRVDGYEVPIMKIVTRGKPSLQEPIKILGIDVFRGEGVVVRLPVMTFPKFKNSIATHHCRVTPKFEKKHIFYLTSEGAIMVKPANFDSVIDEIKCLYKFSNIPGFMERVMSETWWIGCKVCQRPLGSADTFKSKLAARNKLGADCAEHEYRFHRLMGMSDQLALDTTLGDNVGKVSFAWEKMTDVVSTNLPGLGEISMDFVNSCCLLTDLNDAFSQKHEILENLKSSISKTLGLDPKEVMDHIKRLSLVDRVRDVDVESKYQDMYYCSDDPARDINILNFIGYPSNTPLYTSLTNHAGRIKKRKNVSSPPFLTPPSCR